jgi:hypothetical protein
MDAQDPAGWIVIARDSNNDELPRRFVVCISDENDAVAAVSQRVPEQSCVSERPMTAKELASFRLKVGEYVQL